VKIARVFPTKTSMTPSDPDAYFGLPEMFMSDYDEIHISTVFTWDKPRAEYLSDQWSKYGDVKIGGPAYDDAGGQFVTGMYLRNGVTITSRGCPNKCSFCLAQKREGGLREIEIREGNVIQDNNILACSKGHIGRVFEMLKGQHAIEFKGGLEARRVTADIAEKLTSLKIKSLWLACDSPDALSGTIKAIETLKSAGFKRDKVMCYCLIGKDMGEEEDRMFNLFEAGCLPFAQLHMDENDSMDYSTEWRKFQRRWSRPASIKSMCLGVTNARSNI